MKALEAEIKLRVNEITSTQPNVSPLSSLTAKDTKPQDLKLISDKILKILSKQGGRPAGRLFEDVSKGVKSLGRRDFEGVLQNLSDHGEISISNESFEKDGKSIAYRRVTLVMKNLKQFV
jgi:DNA topoisomerase-3